MQYDVKRLLNSRQLESLHRSHDFGWRLAFVRRPLLQDPVFVVYNSEHHLIGILERDGQINTEVDFDIRSTDFHDDQIKAEYWTDKHKCMRLSRSNVKLLLNDQQLKALSRIEKFGWQLNFVQQPLLPQPVAIIISPKGDKLATLELDGRIKLFSRSNACNEVFAERCTAEPFVRRLKDSGIEY
jgi:hypothetical protein